MSKDKGFPLRLDMNPDRAAGYKAFKDGVAIESCPYKLNDPKRGEWRAGYEKAKNDKDKRDEEAYR